MVFDDVKVQLADAIDDYVDYWKESLENLENVYPAESRSKELNDIMTGLKALVGTHSVQPNISDYVSGNSAAKFDPYVTRLSSRLIPLTGVTNTPEKTFFSSCFDTDNKEAAAMLMRLIYMVEFESQSLHYALVARDWLLDEDIRLLSYVQSKQGVTQEMQEIVDALSQISATREVTERLFNAHWGYCRNRYLRDRVVEMTTGLRASHDSIKDAFVNEKRIDDKVAATQLQLFETMKLFQSKSNELLKESDKIRLVEDPDSQVTQTGSFMSMFTPSSKKTPSGMFVSSVKEFQSSPKYNESTLFIQGIMNDLFSSYTKMLETMREFQERERERAVSLSRLRYWHDSSNSLVRSLLDDQSSKNRLPELFYSSMHQELQKTATAKNSLCSKFEQFFVSRSSLLSDGNWSDPESLHTKQSPNDCFSRSNIAKFRRYIIDYKLDSKGTRLMFSRINKVLLVLAYGAVALFLFRSVLVALPSSIQSMHMIAPLVSFVIPPVLKIALPLFALGLIGLNMRNSHCMKSSFQVKLQQFSEDTKRGELDRPEVQNPSLVSQFYQGFQSFVAWLNCFRWSSKTSEDTLSVEEDGEFVGVSSHSLSLSNHSSGSGRAHSINQDNLDQSEILYPDSRNNGRYGGQRSRSVSGNDRFVTIPLHEDDDPSARGYR